MSLLTTSSSSFAPPSYPPHPHPLCARAVLSRPTSPRTGRHPPLRRAGRCRDELERVCRLRHHLRGLHRSGAAPRCYFYKSLRPNLCMLLCLPSPLKPSTSKARAPLGQSWQGVATPRSLTRGLSGRVLRSIQKKRSPIRDHVPLSRGRRRASRRGRPGRCRPGHPRRRASTRPLLAAGYSQHKEGYTEDTTQSRLKESARK